VTGEAWVVATGTKRQKPIGKKIYIFAWSATTVEQHINCAGWLNDFVPGSSPGHCGSAIAALVSIAKSNSLLKGVAN